MADLSQPNNLFSNPDDHLARLLAPEMDEPWYKSFIKNVKDVFNPPKLPPLEVTSKPVPVKDIWGLYGRQKKSFMMSTGGQILFAVFLFTVASSKAVQETVKEAIHLTSPIDLAPPEAPVKPKTMQGGGGGGDRSPLPASKGKLPKQALKQFTPPMAVVNNLNPKLTMEPSIIVPPDVKLPDCPSCANYGDPLAKIGPLSNGPGSGG